MDNKYKHIEKAMQLGSKRLERDLKGEVHVKTGALRNSINSSFKSDRITTSFLDYGSLSTVWDTPYILTIEDFAHILTKPLSNAYAKDIVQIIKDFTKKYNKIKAK